MQNPNLRPKIMENNSQRGKKEENRNLRYFFVILCLNHQISISKVFCDPLQNAVQTVLYCVLCWPISPLGGTIYYQEVQVSSQDTAV